MGRPSGSVAPVGMMFTSIRTGRLRPIEFTYPTENDMSRRSSRSTCTLLSHADCDVKSGSTTLMLWRGSTKVGGTLARLLGKGGAPALVPATETVKLAGSPLFKI